MRVLLLTLLLWTPALAARPPKSPKPPPLPQTELAGFTEAQTYLGQARTVAAALRPDLAALQATPGGPRLVVPLRYGGQVVARVFVSAAGQVLTRGTERTQPDAARPELSAAAWAAFKTQLSALTVSSLARVAGPQVRCYLLSDAQIVAELRFARGSGQLLEDRGPGKRARGPH